MLTYLRIARSTERVWECPDFWSYWQKRSENALLLHQRLVLAFEIYVPALKLSVVVRTLSSVPSTDKKTWIAQSDKDMGSQDCGSETKFWEQ
eukprot:2332461-Amphidinium_carterae.1